MTSIFDFLRQFQGHLDKAGIRYAITSGLAAVHYGIQQTTKDSDWIVALDDLGRLRQLLSALEDGPDRWKIGYRGIFGAPLEAQYLGHGWSSHLSIVLPADAHEQHVDIFSTPPRVPLEAMEHLPNGYVDRHVLALMKRTDRDKDWPVIFACGAQMALLNDPKGILHMQDEEWLAKALGALTNAQQSEVVRVRPLLQAIQRHPERGRRYLLIERMIWQEVNKERYRPYQQALKVFFRRLRQDQAAQWPITGSFAEQHQQVARLCQTHQLPENPLEKKTKAEMIIAALGAVRELLNVSDGELASIAPPPEVLLP